MIKLLSILVFSALTVGSVSLLKTYSKYSRVELKRRANKGDEFAEALWKAVSYGLSLNVLLWGLIGIFASVLFVLLATSLPSWLAIFGCAIVLWLSFAWLPNVRVSEISEKLARAVAPALASVMSKIYPLLNQIAKFVHKHSRIHVHSGIYEKEDLIGLLNKQQKQPDNRMTEAELRIVKHALTFSDILIRDVMTPKRVIKSVKANDSMGPILMAELHDSGFSRFPVEDEEGHIVGTLYLRDLVKAKASGSVDKLMSKNVYYVNEEKPLGHALQAFLKTKHHLFIVVNSFEEVVGLITIEDVLEEVLGKQIVDEFDKYEDLRAVAALQAKKDAKNHKHVEHEEEKSVDNLVEEPKKTDSKKS